MPVIRVSDATWERLKRYARPLEDSADDVVRRALDALDERNTRGTAPQSKSPSSSEALRPTPARDRAKLPQKEFRLPLLQVLLELGGKANVRQIRELLERKMAPRLSEADYEEVSSGDPRWWNAACWERNDLVKEGLFRSDSVRGVWELSEQGQELVSDSAEAEVSSEASSARTWRDDIEVALDPLDRGDGASLYEIYRAVKTIRLGAGRSVPETLEATVRRTLEDNSSDSDNFRGTDLFYMPKGKGAGIWGLRRKRFKR
jgi:hypothetical protein